MNIYRSNDHYDIPICNKDKNSLSQSERLISTDSCDQKLECGCHAFQYRSHQPYCRFWNLEEDQPYYPGCLS